MPGDELLLSFARACAERRLKHWSVEHGHELDRVAYAWRGCGDQFVMGARTVACLRAAQGRQLVVRPAPDPSVVAPSVRGLRDSVRRIVPEMTVAMAAEYLMKVNQL